MKTTWKILIIVTAIAMLLTACDPVNWLWNNRTDNAKNALTVAEDAATATIIAQQANNLLNGIAPTPTLLPPTAAPTLVPPTFVPTAVPPTLAPVTEAPAASTPVPAQAVCEVINDYPLMGLPEVSSAPDSYIHVETFVSGQPEFETILPSGRYSVNQNLTDGGHVWEYSPSCSLDQVAKDVAAHIARRLVLKANNGGYKPYGVYISNGLFTVIKMSGDEFVPTALP